MLYVIQSGLETDCTVISISGISNFINFFNKILILKPNYKIVAIKNLKAKHERNYRYGSLYIRSLKKWRENGK
ncbi:hypothetical protein CN930_30175 [Bacillus cereus]|nr:hypothetical protein CN930_30175 [Bacillus cereus]